MWSNYAGAKHMKAHTDEPVRQATETNEADCKLARASFIGPGKKVKRFTIHHI